MPQRRHVFLTSPPRSICICVIGFLRFLIFRALGAISESGSFAEPSSRVDRLRLRKEKAGLCNTFLGVGSRGGEEGGDESGESSSCGASEEKRARSAAEGLEGAVTDEDVEALQF